jgi:transcriptional regulator with XRE-family HTH domain
MEIGERIKELRLKRKLTQRQLAALSYLTFEYISRVENGHAYPSAKIKKLIADALSVSEKALIKDVEF